MFLTLCHMVACALLGYILNVTQLTPVKPLKSRKQLWKVFLLSIVFCVTIVLGNLSLKHIPISFNQAVGSTTPFFTAIFAAMLQGALCIVQRPPQHDAALASWGQRPAPVVHCSGCTTTALHSVCKRSRACHHSMPLH